MKKFWKDRGHDIICLFVLVVIAVVIGCLGAIAGKTIQERKDKVLITEARVEGYEQGKKETTNNWRHGEFRGQGNIMYARVADGDSFLVYKFIGK
jgi:NADH:ubiquinone oxidoreductase subunit 3 (subunit A)